MNSQRIKVYILSLCWICAMSYPFGNKLVVGSTQSGKSWGEIPSILAAADSGHVGTDAGKSASAIVILDPHHMSLAWNAMGHLLVHGHKKRIIWDNLGELNRTPKYRFLFRSHASNPLVRAKENYQQAEQFGELLLRRRDQQSLAGSPQTEEWVLKAVLLLLNQPHDFPASDLRYALHPGHPKFENVLLPNCTEPDVAFEFQRVASGEIKPGQFAAARRLIEGICGNPSFIARCGTSFDIGSFLDAGGILLVEGGDVSQPVLQTILGSLCMQVIHHLRTRSGGGRILTVIDETTNANLIGAAGHETRACAELQKRGGDFHFLMQSPNLPNSQIANDLFTNCKRHEWYYTASAPVERKGEEDLGSNELSPPLSRLKVRQRWVKDCDRVFFEEAPLLDSPFIFPELTDRRVRQAIAEIRQRPEYGDDSCSTGKAETEPSSNKPQDTSASPDTSFDISPARRLRIAVQKSFANKISSGSSER